MEVNVSNPAALTTPQLNISSVGMVPTRMQTFRLALPCSGLASAEVDVLFTINVTLFKTARDVTPLVFRRRKICLQGMWPIRIDPDCACFSLIGTDADNIRIPSDSDLDFPITLHSL